MGTGKRFHDLFLEKHPICCFCGGAARAETIDHVPPRTLFRDRRWPEGFIFPACNRCNDVTRKDELLVAMLGRMFPDAEKVEHKKEITSLMEGVNNNFPGLLASMHVPRARERRLIKESQIAEEVGVASL